MILLATAIKETLTVVLAVLIVITMTVVEHHTMVALASAVLAADIAVLVAVLAV